MTQCCEFQKCVDTNYHTRVCTSCGVESFYGFAPENVAFGEHYLRPITPTYSRLNRFKDLIRRILAVESGPKACDPVWEYLRRFAPYKNTKTIFEALKTSGLECKHYGNCHLFTQVFAQNYIPHTFSAQEVRHIEQLLCHRFEATLVRWNSFNDGKFFSYNYLIEKYLKEHQLIYFLQFVKQLQCPKRRHKYDLKLKQINDIENAGCAKSLRYQN